MATKETLEQRIGNEPDRQHKLLTIDGGGHGDFFGPVVNLAARLVDAAVPGEVLVDDMVADQTSTEPAGRRMLKGFDEPVRVHSLLVGSPA